MKPTGTHLRRIHELIAEQAPLGLAGMLITVNSQQLAITHYTRTTSYDRIVFALHNDRHAAGIPKAEDQTLINEIYRLQLQGLLP